MKPLQKYRHWHKCGVDTMIPKVTKYYVDPPDIDMIDPWDKSWNRPTASKSMVSLYTSDWDIDCDDLTGTPVSSLPPKWKAAWMNLYFSNTISSASQTSIPINSISTANYGTGGPTGQAMTAAVYMVVSNGGGGIVNAEVGVRDRRRLGQEDVFTFDMPDGSKFVYEKGNYRVEDKDAKVIYKANRVHDFNKFLNSSDLLADFIADLGKLGARQDTALKVPIEVFITWLIYKAAEADGEPPPDIPSVQDKLSLPKPPDLLRCRCCHEPLPAELANEGLQFLDDRHMLVFMRRRGLEKPLYK